MTKLILFFSVSIFFSFLCSILEAVLLSITPTYIKIKKQEKKDFATTLADFKRDIDRPLIAILTLNTIAHTVGAIGVGVSSEEVWGDGGNMVAIVSTIMTLAILIFSEIIPKTIGATYWKSLGNFTAKALTIIIFPLKYTGILWLLLLTTKLIGKSAHVSTMSREEFIAIADAAEQDGVFEENETEVIKNLLVFKSIKVKSIMTPFPVAIIENENVSLKDVYADKKKMGFSRIPIYKDKAHLITGFVLKDDLLSELIEGNGEKPLSSIKRNITIVPPDRSIPLLFQEFVDHREHIAIVADDFGNTIGLITMEDILETLLGLEIMDESDNVADLQKLARQRWQKRNEIQTDTSKAT